jgi:hypothetical protein
MYEAQIQLTVTQDDDGRQSSSSRSLTCMMFHVLHIDSHFRPKQQIDKTHLLRGLYYTFKNKKFILILPFSSSFPTVLSTKFSAVPQVIRVLIQTKKSSFINIEIFRCLHASFIRPVFLVIHYSII